MSKIIEIRPHAKKQLLQRNISEALVKKTLLQPGQIADSYGGRRVAQDIFTEKGEKFLLRVVYEETKKGLKVITVYRTTKIEKYWR